MKDTLKRFTTEDLREASFCLLNKLGLKYNKASRTPITLDNFYNEKKTEQENFVYGHVKEAYFVAALNGNSFTNPNLDAALNVETDNVEKDDKYSSMLVFALEVDADGKLFKMTRTNCAVLTRLFNKISNSLPVVLFIKQNDKLHISTCERSSYKRNHYNGEKLGKVSMLMGINCANAHTGHCRILEKLMVSPSVHGFDDLYRHWLDKFNTKTLTEDFYTDLYKWFMWVVYDDNAKFPENSHLSKAENEEKNTKVIRLITRLMFVWFLKEKRLKKKEGETSGTAVGSETAAISALRVKEGETSGLVPDCIFDVNKLKDILADFDANSATEGNYYNAILQNLFFATLNNEVEARRFVDTPFQGRSKGYMVKVLFRDNKKKSWFRISHDEVLQIFEKVPYLNCGLFECLDKYKRTDISYDKDRIFDGFSTRDDSNYRTCLPNRLFFAAELPEKRIEIEIDGEKKIEEIKSKGIVKIFEDYVFTVEENTPMDQQVSLDPELLGKVFENLLAAYNPETSSDARNSSGSFYTPREIVEYMVTESLIQYLKTSLNDEVEEEQLRNLVSSEEKGFELKEVQTEKILEALYQCKVLDPACGSGAFPMGMLQQMVHVIERLDKGNQYGKNNPCYARKLFLIQNCLFGVDIQPIAMMISKLRFFISLICEQDEDSVDFNDKKNNYCINTLPNLETKFVAANSLLTPDIHKFSGDWTNDQHLEQLKDELMELRRLHFSAKSQSEKLKIRTRDEQKRMEIIDYILSTQAHADQEKISLLQDQINHLAAERKAYEGEKIVDEYCEAQTSLFDAPQPTLFHRDVNKARREEIDRQILRCQAEIAREQSKENIVGFEAAVKQITDWNPYDQIKASPFFDPDWMFGVKVDADSGVGFDIVIGNPPYINVELMSAIDKEIYKKCFKCFYKRSDIFALFLENALMNLSSTKAVVTFIIPSAVHSNLSYQPLRDIILKNGWLKEVCYTGGNVFNAPTIDTTILICNKQENEKILLKNAVDFNNHIAHSVPSNYFSTFNNVISIGDKDTDSIFGKLFAPKHPVMDSLFTIYQGIVTGNNPAFIFETKQEAIEKGIEEELLHPMCHGRDIERYAVRSRERQMMYVDSSIDVSNYPNAEKWLLQFKDALDKRNEGKHDTISWCSLHRPRVKSELNLKEKILVQNTRNEALKIRIVATLDDQGVYGTQGLNFIIPKTDEFSLRYVLGILNSTLINYLFSTKFLNLAIKADFLKQVHIPKANKTVQQSIEDLVDSIISIKKENIASDTSAEEQEIDRLVYELYGLTNAEVKIIDKDEMIGADDELFKA